MELTKNFTLEEMTASNIAKSKKIDNTPNEKQIEALKALCENVLQPVRDVLGVIKVNVGFRSEALNKATKNSSKTSQHCKGEAADLDSADNAKLFNYIRAHVPFDQLIWERGDDHQPDWVHVSFVSGKPNRRQVLRCYFIDGEPHYKPM
jgi:zinc D-Ala-D-Ala carboxypeptidase